MSGTKGIQYFDYKKLLASPLKRDSAWNDLAEVCNKVLQREVDERRRRLTSSRDSVKNRKGDYLSQITYLPESDKPAIYAETGKPASINVGDTIPVAQITRVINNGSFYGQADQIDYFEVQFKIKNKIVKWLLPTSAPQERSLLISNAYNLGFDYFNTNLSTKDYERLYEYLNMFFNENGFNDIFIKFIGYIKNLRIEGLPLWSIDDGTDRITILDADVQDYQKAVNGGEWYLTSHVELRININDQNYNYPIDLTEIEELFYLFAPIMLVLERIVFEIDADNLKLFAIATQNITIYEAGLIDKRSNPYLFDTITLEANLNYYEAALLKIAPPVPKYDFTFYRNHGLYFELGLNRDIAASQQTTFVITDKQDNILYQTNDLSSKIEIGTGRQVNINIPIEQLPTSLPDYFRYQLRSIINWTNIKDVFGSIKLLDGPEVTFDGLKALSLSNINIYEAATLKMSHNKMPLQSYIREPQITPVSLQATFATGFCLVEQAVLYVPRAVLT